MSNPADAINPKAKRKPRIPAEPKTRGSIYVRQQTTNFTACKRVFFYFFQSELNFALRPSVFSTSLATRPSTSSAVTVPTCLSSSMWR